MSDLKKTVCTLLLLALSAAAAQRLGAQVPGNEMKTIEIGMLSTTHVLFTSDLTYVDISSQDVILAKVVDASKNMLALKARKEFDYITTISALEANGTMHTFKVRFNSFPPQLVVDTRQRADESAVAQVNTQIRPDGQGSAPGAQQAQPVQSERKGGFLGLFGGRDSRHRGADGKESSSGYNVSGQGSNFGRADAPTLEEIMRRDQNVFHVGDKSYKIEAYCINVYAYSDLTYIVISLRNGSDIGYEAGDAQFRIESRSKSSRTLTSDKDVWPKSSYGTLSCAPRGTTMVGYTIPKLTLLDSEILRIYIYEKGGNRNLFLSLTDKDINYAVSPFNN